MSALIGLFTLFLAANDNIMATSEKLTLSKSASSLFLTLFVKDVSSETPNSMIL